MAKQNSGNDQKNPIDKDTLLVTVLAHNQKLLEQNQKLTGQVELLTRQVAELKKELDKNSRNSNEPPSKDRLGERGKIRKKKKPTGRLKGAQKGHKGHCRQLVPVEEVDRILDFFPGPCDVCQQTPPQVVCDNPIRYQVVELLPNGAPHITEYRRHRIECECGEQLVAPEDEVPISAFGPRLKSFICMLTGEYHLSRRQVVVFLNDVYRIKISLGSVSNFEGQMTKVLQKPCDDCMAEVVKSDIKHLDETSWIRDFERCSVWVFATAFISVFRIAKNGRRSTLLRILGKKHRGILISDRASVFLFWSMQKRQVCWSHLLRAFVGFSQRDGPAGVIGKDLVTCAELVLGYWRAYSSGSVTRERFELCIDAVRRVTKQLLERAVEAEISEFSGSCANMLKHWEAMWTFINTKGVEPTNNHAERELRKLVLWRKKCFGSQSERGDRFVERMMTVTHTLRKQGRRVLNFLHACFQAEWEKTSAPKLVPST